jgi:nicotinamide mononucleotide adenylyltransferase
MHKLGAAQGRFHMIHWGHMEYLIECKKKCEFLFIGVSDTDPQNAYFHERYEDNGSNDVFRGLYEPQIYTFTYFERAQMITEALKGEGVPTDEFMVVPFPIHRPQQIKYFVPQEAVIYITVYDPWGERKPKLFGDLGYETELLWRRTMDERFTTATEVRRRMSEGEDFSDLVPEGVKKVVDMYNLTEKLKNCQK